MTLQLQLRFTLQSDATFGRGDGVAGYVDVEIEHDNSTGLPYLHGRALKGLLAEECANILYALDQQGNPALDLFNNAALALFGRPGSTLNDDGALHVGNAQLPEALRIAVANDVEAKRLQSAEVLESLTAVRRSSAINVETGAPLRETLRSIRVLLRGLTLCADISIEDPVTADMKGLLAACVLGMRRAGVSRNRGRGRLCNMQLHSRPKVTNGDMTDTMFKLFTSAMSTHKGAH